MALFFLAFLQRRPAFFLIKYLSAAAAAAGIFVATAINSAQEARNSHVLVEGLFSAFGANKVFL